MKGKRKLLLCLLCLLCIVGGIFVFPFPLSVAKKEVTSITASIDYDPTPVEFTDPAAIADFTGAFSPLFAHFRLSAFIPAGGMGYDITFHYADGTEDTYQHFGTRIWKNGAGIPLEISDKAWEDIYGAMHTWYFHGLDWIEWTEAQRKEPPDE